MNERIRLLKHQASLWCDENIPEQFSEETNSYGRAWEDKFAELIVRECAKVAGDFEYARLHDSLVEDKILEHFGVEE